MTYKLKKESEAEISAPVVTQNGHASLLGSWRYFVYHDTSPQPNSDNKLHQQKIIYHDAIKKSVGYRKF